MTVVDHVKFWALVVPLMNVHHTPAVVVEIAGNEIVQEAPVSW
jgi:hypothetical protein